MIKTIVTTRLRTLAAAVRHLTGAAPASLLLILTLLTACQQDNLVTDAQGNALNPDGTVTITQLNVSIGTEAATRADRPAADKGYTAGVKTGFVQGDVLHLLVFLTEDDWTRKTPQLSSATFDGSSKWTLNPAIRLPQDATKTFGIQIFYDGTTTAYDSYLLEGSGSGDSGNPFYAPGNFARAYREAVYHVNDGTFWTTPETAKPLEDANGNAYFHDALHCTGGSGNAKIGFLTIGAHGTLDVTMEHANALVRITSVDNKLESPVACAELITKGNSDKTPTTFTLWGEDETAGTPGTIPWQAVIGTADFGDSNANPPYVLGSIRITLADGRSFTVSLPLPPDADPIEPTDPTSGFCAKPNHVYAYRLTLKPGSLTAVPVSTSGDLSWTSKPVPAPAGYTAIYNRKDLEAIGASAESMKGKYILMNDIKLTPADPNAPTAAERWTPLGYDASGSSITPFSGHFNGNGYSILGLTISNSDKKKNIGLFASLNNALIYNLHFSKAKIESYTLADSETGIGTLAGYAYSSTVSLCSATDCNVTYSNRNFSPISIGALIGYSTGNSTDDSDYKTTLTQCHATRCTVNGGNAYYAGGLVGRTMNYNRLVACYTRACTVSLNSTDEKHFAGGLIGSTMGYKSLIYGCYATNANPSGGKAHGALVGNNYSRNTNGTIASINLIASCYATLATDATDANALLVGFNGYPSSGNDYGNFFGAAKILACVSPQSVRTAEQPTDDKKYVVSLSARATSRGYLPLTDTAEIIALTEGTATAPGTTPEEQAANAAAIKETFDNFGFTANDNTLSLTVNAVKIDATTGALTTGQLTFGSTAPIWPGLTEATKMIPPMIKW